ncbi:bifunctional nicotinamidase/pyrazinamidase [Pararobbsia alpina]|uniref:Nicotinamidase n=1 Tax=Pararobbsia alpina TaxID=621374 RepID=A0A6S7C2E6_9BURK|nr:bifunctional nicotinamidase/pyrazinamidase [Pararobbsia alpina]CAB3799782.1 Nicotinamidase [Pararobbsia alpina]
MRPSSDVLLVVDVQYDFMPGGALAVPFGDEVVAPINRLAKGFSHVVLTQDWHPADHASFAVNHPGSKPFARTHMPYGEQVLWPSHCVQGTRGAQLHEGLSIPQARMLIRKGHHREVDSYSAFVEADRETPTGLTGYLRETGVKRVFCCGLATDFCVAWSALDARACGFQSFVIEEASRPIDLDGSLEAAWLQFNDMGIENLEVDEVLSMAVG